MTAMPYPVAGVRNDLLPLLQAIVHSGIQAAAPTRDDFAQGGTLVFNHKHRPVIVAAKQCAGRELQYCIAFPQYEACFDAKADTQR